MEHRLSVEESRYLSEQFKLFEYTEGEEKLALERLLDKEFLEDFLQKNKSELGTESLFVAASQFIKRLGYVLMVPAFYSASAYNKMLKVDLWHGQLVIRNVKGKWMPHLFLEDQSVAILTGPDRQLHFENFSHQLLAALAKIIDNVSEVAKVPKTILWENAVIYIYWLYESRFKNARKGVQLQAQEDFQFLLEKLPGIAFNLNSNPLKKYYHDKTQLSSLSEPIRIRQTCCFYYEIAGDRQYCKTCPKKNLKMANETETNKISLKI